VRYSIPVVELLDLVSILGGRVISKVKLAERIRVERCVKLIHDPPVFVVTKHEYIDLVIPW
jgi:hypothetical protein